MGLLPGNSGKTHFTGQYGMGTDGFPLVTHPGWQSFRAKGATTFWNGG